MYVPDSELATGFLENSKDRVADAAELASSVRRDAVHSPRPTELLLPVEVRETLEHPATSPDASGAGQEARTRGIWFTKNGSRLDMEG